MFADTLSRELLLSVMEQLVTQELASSARRGGATALSAEDASIVRAAIAEAIERERGSSSAPRGTKEETGRAKGGTEIEPRISERAFISSDPIVSIVQSALDLFAASVISPSVSTNAGDATRRGLASQDVVMVTDRSAGWLEKLGGGQARRIFEKFSVTDLAWISSVVAQGIRGLNGKRPFNPQPADEVQLPATSRIVLVGDWGSGVPRAQAVARHMRTHIEDSLTQNASVHVIHLGDVYYSGWPSEYTERFLKFWPVEIAEADRVGSWCLNGNHDMYSGGHGYFDTALADARFARWQKNAQGATSFFKLGNANWQILGLDSSWQDGALQDPQASWLKANLAGVDPRKTMLLSHHQFVSAYEEPARELVKTVEPILAEFPVRAWFWGHEHRAMRFAAQPEIGYPRCLGDGGVPVYQWHLPADPCPAPGVFEHRNAYERGLERWAFMGFAVLDIENAQIDVRYFDEEGSMYARETIS
jgi:hypothetical protein